MFIYFNAQAKYYLCTCDFEFSQSSIQTQSLIQPLALINSRWKRNRKNCRSFQNVWNMFGAEFDFQLQTSNEREINRKNLARRVFTKLKKHCKDDFFNSLSFICLKMNDNLMLGNTNDAINARFRKS